MNIYEKLLNVQKELKAPKNQYNSFGRYNYRSAEDILEALKPICHKNKAIVFLTDDIISIGMVSERGEVLERTYPMNYVKATAKFVDIETGEEIIVTANAREEFEKKGMDGSQITGSSSSYARKYALNGLFDIDDTKDSDFTNDGKDDKKETKEPKLICEECGCEINEKVSKYSLERYGKELCFDCQKKIPVKQVEV